MIKLLNEPDIKTWYELNDLFDEVLLLNSALCMDNKEERDVLRQALIVELEAFLRCNERYK